MRTLPANSGKVVWNPDAAMFVQDLPRNMGVDYKVVTSSEELLV